MHDALEDPLLLPALKAFLYEQRLHVRDQILAAIRKSQRDTMKEAHLSGMDAAYENFLNDLKHYSQEQLQDATQ